MSAARDAALAAAEALERADAEGLNATLSWSREFLEREAARADAAQRSGGTTSPLYGYAVAVKDNILTTDLPTTCASRMLEGYMSPCNATVIDRLRAAGAMVACKTNMDEFAMGSSTEHSAFGRVRHPFDATRVPGGSSGGSAALVASGAVRVALGSETGGSVRQPAAFCGVVGVKPSYGRVSRNGLVAFGSSLDSVSIFGATVDDASRLLSAISGHDPLDSTTTQTPPMGRPDVWDDLDGVRIGLPREYFPENLDPGVRAGVDRGVAALRELGATIVDISLPHTRYAVPTYYIVAPAEASSNLARYDGVRYGARAAVDGDIRALYRATRGEGFGAEVRRRILVGTFVLSAGYYDAYYRKAQQVRALIADDFQQVFDSGVDLIFTPTTPTPAFRAGEKTEDPLAMYLADIFVCPANLAGLPAASVPVGRTEGLPVGGQIIAPYFRDSRMLSVATLLERALAPAAEVR